MCEPHLILVSITECISGPKRFNNRPSLWMPVLVGARWWTGSWDGMCSLFRPPGARQIKTHQSPPSPPGATGIASSSKGQRACNVGAPSLNPTSSTLCGARQSFSFRAPRTGLAFLALAFFCCPFVSHPACFFRPLSFLPFCFSLSQCLDSVSVAAILQQTLFSFSST